MSEPQKRRLVFCASLQYSAPSGMRRRLLAFRLKTRRGRKVRTPYGSAGVNDPPPQGEEQWNRENVRGIEPEAGNGKPRGSRRSENSQTLHGARSNRGALSTASVRLPGKIARADG